MDESDDEVPDHDPLWMPLRDCPTCGKGNGPGLKTCWNCGEALTQEGEGC